MDMTKFVIGKPFPIPVYGMFMLRLIGSQLNVVLNYPDPTKREQEAFQDGIMSIRVYLHPSGNAFFLLKFETEDDSWKWMDVPIHYSQNTKESLTDFYKICEKMEGQDEKVTPMALLFIDANTRILKQMRMVGPHPSLILKIRDIFQMQEQKHIPYDEAMIHVIYSQMDSEEMASKAQERMVLKKE